MSCLVFSCRVLSYLVLSFRVLSFRVLSFRVLSCLVLSCLILSCFSCLVLSCLFVSCFVLSCLACLVLFCLFLSCLVSPCHVFSWFGCCVFFFRVLSVAGMDRLRSPADLIKTRPAISPPSLSLDGPSGLDLGWKCHPSKSGEWSVRQPECTSATHEIEKTPCIFARTAAPLYGWYGVFRGR